MPVWRPVLVNLALGVPAIIPLYCAWWVLYDVVWPLGRGYRLGPWLAAAALVLVPFDLLWGPAALSWTARPGARHAAA